MVKVVSFDGWRRDVLSVTSRRHFSLTSFLLPLMTRGRQPMHSFQTHQRLVIIGLIWRNCCSDIDSVRSIETRWKYPEPTRNSWLIFNQHPSYGQYRFSHPDSTIASAPQTYFRPFWGWGKWFNIDLITSTRYIEHNSMWYRICWIWRF